MPEYGHIPVLSEEVASLLDPQTNEVIVDLTAGRGGHAHLLATIAGKTSTVVLFDLDKTNLDYAAKRIRELGVNVHAIHGNFATSAHAITELGLRADCVLADLGFASNQMDCSQRGLSFKDDGPLDMRLNTDAGVTAADIIETSSETELADMIFQLGEDPYSRRIARKIAQERQIKRSAYGARARSSRMHPATRTFMALRIAVNGELEALDALLEDMQAGCRMVNENGWLNVGARLAVISFHSLEDRRVKHSFVNLEKCGLAKRLTRKPICASDEEIVANPRSRPAKLRAVHVLPEA